MLAGCGGGDDKKKNQDRCTDNILFLFFCVLPSSVDTTGSNDAAAWLLSLNTNPTTFSTMRIL